MAEDNDVLLGGRYFPLWPSQPYVFCYVISRIKSEIISFNRISDWYRTFLFLFTSLCNL